MQIVLTILFGYIPLLFALVGGSLYMLEFILFIPKRKKAKEMANKITAEFKNIQSNKCAE